MVRRFARRIILIHLLILLVFYTGHTDEGQKTHPAFVGPTELYLVGGVTVASVIDLDYPFDRNDTSLFRSIIVNGLRRNGIKVIDDIEDTTTSSNCLNPVDLLFSVEILPLRMEDGTHSGFLVVSVSLTAFDNVSIPKWESITAIANNDLADLPGAYVGIWEKSLLACCGQNLLREHLKENASDLTELFVTDFWSQNSDATRAQLKERDRFWDSLIQSFKSIDTSK